MVDRVKATAAPTTVTLGKREFKMSPMSDEDMATMDQWVRARHVRIARDTLPKDADEEQKDRTERIALEQASRMSFASGMGASLMHHIDAMAQLFWCGIRGHHPEMTPEAVKGLILEPGNLEAMQDEWDRMNTSRRQAATKDEKKKKSRRKTVRESRRRNR